MNMPNATALIIDTETDQGRDPRPIQVATINVATGFEWMRYFNSGRAITAAVTKIHGITDEDVAELESFDLDKFELPDYLIAHNVRFDWRVIGSPSAKLICTVRLARAAFPEWHSYGQSKCIEQLIGVEAATKMTALAHDALGDARMCYLLYQACCARLGFAATDFERAHKVSNTAQPISIMPFGKYKGKRIQDVPVSYARWMLEHVQGMKPSLYSALIKRIEAPDVEASKLNLSKSKVAKVKE